MFKKVFSFEGRIRRLEYGLTYLAYVVVTNALKYFLTGTGDIGLFIQLAIIFLFLWILLAQGAKRCHDRDNSGWYQIIPFYFLWMIFADGEPGPNQYGDNPKGIGNITEIDQIGTNPEN